MRSLLAAAALLLVWPRFAPAQPTAPRVRLVEELRLDATVEDFPTVSRVHVGPRGQIVVPIVQDMQLRIYDSTGKRVAAVGRRGAGPVEFQAMSIVGWLRDTLWVGDIRQRRTTFIGPDHEVLRTTPWPQNEGSQGGNEPRMWSFAPLALLSDGSAIGQALIESTVDGQQKVQGVYAHRSASGAMRALIETGYMEDQPWMMVVSGLGRSVPFVLSPQYAFANDGSRIAELTAPAPRGAEGAFTVTVRGPRGDTLASRAFPFRGVPIPREARDSALASFIPPEGRPREGPPDLPQRFQAIARERMTAVYTPVESILLGLDRTIWLALRPTSEGRGYLILDGSAEPIGSLQVPAGTRVRQASATHVWVTETDADGLSSVVRYRAVGLPCGPARC
jgi:hypothetical protein